MMHLKTLNGDGRDIFLKCTVYNTHLAVVWVAEDVHSAWLDAVGFCPPEKSKAAPLPTVISAWQRAIVPEREREERCFVFLN